MHRYSAKQLRFLRRGWLKHQIPELTKRFNFRFKTKKTERAIKSAITNHHYRCGRPVGNPVGTLRTYTKAHERFIRKAYRRMTEAQVVVALNKKFHSHFSQNQIAGFINNHKILSGRTGCYEKGIIPWNYGTKGTGICKGNSGNFKKGHVPANRVPLGTERIDRDGYIQVKIRERNPYTGEPTRFKLKHVVVWERAHGPVPKNTMIRFVDGNRKNCNIKNLMLASMAENLRLNQHGYNNSPRKIKKSILAISKLECRLFHIARKKGKKIKLSTTYHSPVWLKAIRKAMRKRWHGENKA